MNNKDPQLDLPNTDSQTPETRCDVSTELAMGGQALLEGVMMRGPGRIAIAVRKPDSSIALRTYPYTPITKRVKWLGLPIIRGAAGMVEALKIGVDALNWSAEHAMPEEESAPRETSPWKERLSKIFSILLALGFGLGLFMLLPYWLAKLSVGADQGQTIFHLIAGGVRVSLLIGYMWVISRFKEIHRVFQYHGSEHKTIFAFEKGEDLTPEQVLTQTRLHPRCGTSFLLIVALSAILFFVIVDSLIVTFIGPFPNVLVRFLVHLPLIPLVAGLSYEILKISSKNTKNPLVRAFIQPGLWLQKITTQEPDASMCEVAILSLKTALHGPETNKDEDYITFIPATEPAQAVD